MKRLMAMLFDGGAGSAGVATFPKVEVPAAFALTDPKKDVPEAIEKVRATLVDLDKRGQAHGEAFVKVCADLDEIRTFATEARDTARNLVREVPGPEGPDAPIQSLKHVSLSLDVKADEERSLAGSSDADLHVAQEFGRLPRGQYNLLVRTPKELGITDERTVRQLKRLHALHDATVFMNLAHEKDLNYIMAGAHKSLPWWTELVALGKKFTGALSDATTNEGKEWVPVNILSSTVVELIELELQFAGAFQRIPMTGPTMKLPVKKAHTVSKYIQENVADAGDTTDATLIASSFQTQDVTFTARKHAALVYTSSEWEQDAVVNVPTYIASEMATAIARGLEDALVNGQKSGTIDGTAPASTSTQAMVDGIRKAFALTGLVGKDLGVGMIAEDLAAIFGAQKAFGARPQDCVWLTGTAGVARLLVTKFSDGSPVALTQAQLGSLATFQTGVLAVVFGRRVYASEFVSEVMDAVGIIPSVADSRTALYHINTRPFKIGDRRGVVVDRSMEFRFIQDQLAYRAIARNDFQSAFTPSATSPVVNAGLNIATF